MDSTEFHRYSMDCIKYSVNIDLVNEQLNHLREVNDSLELTPSQLDAKIQENNARVAQLTKDIAEKQNVLLKLKNDLRSLQFIGTQSICAKKVQDDGEWRMSMEIQLRQNLQLYRPQPSKALTKHRYATVSMNFWLRAVFWRVALVSNSD